MSDDAHVITIEFSDGDEASRAYDAIEALLHSLGEIGTLGSSVISRPSADGGQPSPDKDRRPGFDVGAGTVKEGDEAVYDGRPCKVLAVYHDGDVQIEIPTYKTVKWRFVTPAAQPPRQETPAVTDEVTAEHIAALAEAKWANKAAPSADEDAMQTACRVWYTEITTMPTVHGKLDKLAAALTTAKAQAYERAEAAVRGCPSVDDNGYICEKSAAIKAIRALSGRSHCCEGERPGNDGDIDGRG